MKSFYTLLLCLLIFTSCKKDSPEPDSEDTTQVYTKKSQVSIEQTYTLIQVGNTGKRMWKFKGQNETFFINVSKDNFNNPKAKAGVIFGGSFLQEFLQED